MRPVRLIFVPRGRLEGTGIRASLTAWRIIGLLGSTVESASAPDRRMEVMGSIAWRVIVLQWVPTTAPYRLGTHYNFTIHRRQQSAV
jgi:hypothetical protein